MGANRYSIREQTSGRFQARWYDNNGDRKSKTFGTRTEAKKFLDGIKADRDRGDYIDPNDSRRTFRSVAELWLSSRNLRPKTENNYREMLELRIYPTFADRPVGGITTMDLVAWITALSRTGGLITAATQPATDIAPAVRPLSPGTVRNAVRVATQVLDAAVRARYIRGNPARGLTRDDMPKDHRKEAQFLTAAEVSALSAAVEQVVAARIQGDTRQPRGQAGQPRKAPDPNTPTYAQHAAALGLLVRFAAQTGMRAGEICGLRWENVDLLRGRVIVAESISAVRMNEWTVVPPKNGKTRTVPLTPPMRDALADLAEQRAERGTFAPEMYVWPRAYRPTSTEEPYGTEPMRWGTDFYLRYWKPAVAEAGLNSGLRFHDLRHTCAALLIAANVPAKAIQAHLGHSSFNITMSTYGHLYEDASDAVTDAMGAAFSAPATPTPSNVRALRG
ncbi:tyrosine-type recombinase/integrase [Rhodococcus sp. NPDC058521]|uniref:tyrosine-type recombinase/integrase n=1 Tax=Rhodococcus sp. NPDC058521 TaxID=3346536 RepID=UPI003648A437